LPLSKQAPEVRESLTRFGLRADPDAARAYDDALLKALYSESPVSLPKQPRDPMGQEIYQHSLRMSPEEATRALREAGIPGTRYLDAGSRGVGGSYNYAVFDPEIIDITRRYAEGGLAELDQKYAEGGMVREPATAYDPDEIDRIVQEFAEGGEVNRELMGQPFLNDYSRYSYAERPEIDWAGGKRPLNVQNLYDLGAFRFAHWNGDPSSLSLVSYFNDSSPDSVTTNWPTVSRERAQEALSSFTENPWPLYTGKYNQIVDSARRLGISDEDIFLPQNTSTAEGFAEGGEVEAPAKTYIGGQEHKLAYITDREAALLKARGGSGRMTKHGIRAYDEGPGEGPGSDNANSMSEAATQDAVGGNQGQGAGPTGAGAGAGPPGPPDSNPNQSMSSEDPENTQAAANMNTAVAAQQAGRGMGIADTGGVAPTGFNAAPGIAEALGALGRGEIGFGQALGYGVQSALSPPGAQIGVNVDELGNQTPAVSVSVPGVIGGLMGLATGIPGASAIGSMIGNEIGKELGLDPTVMSYEPGVFNAPEPTPAYGAAGYGMDYGQGYAHGGLAKLHQKYAEGGEVEGNGGVERYDPREIDALASKFMAESNPADLMQRARMMMRGMNVGMPTSVGAVDLPENYQRYPRNENVSSFTSLREMPIEDDRFERALRTINTGINATLDQERKIRLGAGLLGVQDASDQGMTGYGANLSAGYGPVSLHGGYQSQLQAYPGAKPQEFYTYGGNLNIPLDDEGAKALLGAQVMSGRRGSAGARVVLRGHSVEAPWV